MLVICMVKTLCTGTEIYISYKVEYTNGSCRGYWPPKPVVVAVQSTAQLIDIMQTASDMDKRYQFQADFDGDYHITTMDGRSNTENCTWLVYMLQVLGNWR